MKGSILFLEIVYFYIGGGMNKKQQSMGGGGGAHHSIWHVKELKKDGCVHAQPKPSCESILY